MHANVRQVLCTELHPQPCKELFGSSGLPYDLSYSFVRTGGGQHVSGRELEILGMKAGVRVGMKKEETVHFSSAKGSSGSVKNRRTESTTNHISPL